MFPEQGHEASEGKGSESRSSSIKVYFYIRYTWIINIIQVNIDIRYTSILEIFSDII